MKTVQSARHHQLGAAIVPAVAFILVMSMTAFAVVWVTRLEQRANEIAFETAARDRTAAVRREFEISGAVVESIGSFFDASTEVNDENFALFATSLRERHKSISGLGWVPRVKDEDRERHELAGQHYYADYQITQRLIQGEMVRRDSAEEYFPVRFVVPYETNEAAVGFDLGSDAVRRASLFEAADCGKLTSTAPVQLVQEVVPEGVPAEQPRMSVIFYQPVYQDPLRERSVADRSRDFSGVISAVFRADSLVDQSLTSFAPAGLDFELVDVTEPSRPVFLAMHRSRTRTDDTVVGPPENSALRSELGFEVAGRRFRLDFKNAPGQFETTISPAALGLLTFGPLLAFAIAALLHTLQRSDSQARAHVVQLQRLSQRLISVQESERHHLARELHDHLGQDLTALRINLHLVSEATDGASRERYLGESNAIIDRILVQVRTISLNLRPTVLDDLGLQPALHSYLKREAKRSGLQLDYECEYAIGRLSEAVETATFRFSQEAVTNVVRHAEASSLYVALALVDGELEIEISDDGIGFDPSASRDQAGHFTSCGLLGMQERVTFVSGTMQVQSRPGTGTTLTARIPIG